jgi:hypothetical protein
MQTQNRNHSLKAPPRLGRSDRKSNGLLAKALPLASGGSGSGSMTVSYSASTTVADGDFVVSLSVSPQIVGDDDWMGIFASQTDLQSCINNINTGGSGSNYLTWEYVVDFDSSGSSLTWNSSYGVTDGAIFAYFTKNFANGNYVYVFATSPYQS